MRVGGGLSTRSQASTFSLMLWDEQDRGVYRQNNILLLLGAVALPASTWLPRALPTWLFFFFSLYIASCISFKEVPLQVSASRGLKSLLFVTRHAAGLRADAGLCVRAVCVPRPWCSGASRSTVSHAALWYKSLWEGDVTAACVAVQKKDWHWVNWALISPFVRAAGQAAFVVCTVITVGTQMTNAKAPESVERIWEFTWFHQPTFLWFYYCIIIIIVFLLSICFSP